ncbi:hypothetical protein C8F01DRAFT_1134788 [Mycena amicta]|nr:hypothetical protein C8F01DRAFT_1134788 [Mycena amicta]
MGHVVFFPPTPTAPMRPPGFSSANALNPAAAPPLLPHRHLSPPHDPIRRLRPGTNKPPHKNQDHPRQESSRSALLAPAHRTTLPAVNAHKRKTKTLRAHCHVTTFAQVEERSQQGHSHSCKHWCSPRHPALVPLSPLSSPAQSATSQVLPSTPRFLNGPSPNTR